MSIYLDILVITVLTALVLAIPGNLLVLRGTSLSTFALSHSMLIGIVLAFLVVGDLNSPLLVVGAAITGVVIVWLVELLAKSQFVNLDASLGIIYLLFFALGIIIVSRYTSSSVISVDTALLGSIGLVIFDHLTISGKDLGPTVIWYLIALLLLNSVVLILFYKELKISVFDPHYARIYDLKPDLMNLLYMTLVSLTIVVTFRVAGLIIVVALATIPGAAAYLVSKRFHHMLLLSSVFAIASAIIGVGIAWQIGDVEVASVTSTISGIIFLVVLALKQIVLKNKGNVGVDNDN